MIQLQLCGQGIVLGYNTIHSRVPEIGTFCGLRNFEQQKSIIVLGFGTLYYIPQGIRVCAFVCNALNKKVQIVDLLYRSTWDYFFFSVYTCLLRIFVMKVRLATVNRYLLNIAQM